MSKTYQCQICKKAKKLNELVPSDLIRPAIVNLIQKVHPEVNDTGYICYTDLNVFRNRYIQQMLEEEKGELTELDRSVLQSFSDNEILTRNLEAEYKENLKPVIDSRIK